MVMNTGADIVRSFTTRSVKPCRLLVTLAVALSVSVPRVGQATEDDQGPKSPTLHRLVVPEDVMTLPSPVIRWKAQGASAATIAGQVVVVASDAQLRAHNLSDGAMIWSRVLPPGYGPLWSWTTPLTTVSEDHVLLLTRDVVSLIEVATGTEKWSSTGPWWSVVAAFDSGPVLVTRGQTNAAVALSGVDGSERWRFEFASILERVHFSGMAHGTLVFNDGRRRFFRLSETGEVLADWRIPDEPRLTLHLSVATSDGLITACSRSSCSGYNAFGGHGWSREYPVEIAPARQVVGHLLVGRERHRVIAMNPRHGELEWVMEVEGGTPSRVYALDAEHAFIIVDLPDGSDPLAALIKIATGEVMGLRSWLRSGESAVHGRMTILPTPGGLSAVVWPETGPPLRSRLSAQEEVASRIERLLDPSHVQSVEVSWLRRHAPAYRQPLLARLRGASPTEVARAAPLLDPRRRRPDYALLVATAESLLAGPLQTGDWNNLALIVRRLGARAPPDLVKRASDLAAGAISSFENSDRLLLGTQGPFRDDSEAYRYQRLTAAVALARAVVDTATLVVQPGLDSAIHQAIAGLPRLVAADHQVAGEDRPSFLEEVLSELTVDAEGVCVPEAATPEHVAISRMLVQRWTLLSTSTRPMIVAGPGFGCVELPSLGGPVVALTPAAARRYPSSRRRGMDGPRIQTITGIVPRDAGPRTWLPGHRQPEDWLAERSLGNEPDAFRTVTVSLPGSGSEEVVGRIGGRWYWLGSGGLWIF